MGVRSEGTTRGATEATQYGREGQDGQVGSADWQVVQIMGPSLVRHSSLVLDRHTLRFVMDLFFSSSLIR